MLLAPTKLEATTSGSATARVGVGVLGELPFRKEKRKKKTLPAGCDTEDGKCPWAWALSVVVSAAVDTNDGAAALFGADKSGVTSSPTGSLGLSFQLAALDVRAAGPGSPYLPLSVFFGADVGRTTYTYLAPRTSDMLLEEHDGVGKVSTGFGTSGFLIPTGEKFRPTVEWVASYRSAYSPSTTTVKWCDTAGQVANGTSPPLDAQSCSEGLVGAPNHAKSTTFGGQVGVLAADSGHRWRTALGAQATVPSNSSGTYRALVSLRLPFYLSLVASDSGFSSYTGIIQLTPQCSITVPEHRSASFTAALNLRFLGQRTLFADAYNATL